MKNQTFCSRYFKKLHQFGTIFIQGFLHLVGAGENPFEKDVEKIFNRTDHEALRGDIEKVSNDFVKAFNRYKNQLPS